MAELIYPTLDLFLYDLRNGLGDTDAEIEQNRAQFVQKLPTEVRPQIAQQDRYFEAEYQELLPARYVTFADKKKPYPIQGYYYPVRLNDVYGLLLDASVDNKVEPQPVACFEVLKTALEAQLHPQTASLGQTWMLSGWLPDVQTQSAAETAQQCYQAFLPEGNWKQDLEGQGSLLGAQMFALWRYRSTLQEGASETAGVQSLQQNQHVMILIFPNQAAAEKAANLYDDWLRLFSFRNKILWAYSQSRVIKQLIKTDFTTVHSGQQRSQSFDEFRDVLSWIQDALNHYKVNLIQLDFQGRTIDINLSNYKKRLQRIAKESGPDTDLAFLDDFAEVVENKYLLQITKDAENMTLGLRLLEDEINATQSRLEVEKAERDRNFQRLVKYLGTGWATATVVSGTVEIPKGTLPLPSRIAFLEPLLVVILIAGMAAGLIGVSTAAWNARRRFWKVGGRQSE